MLENDPVRFAALQLFYLILIQGKLQAAIQSTGQNMNTLSLESLEELIPGSHSGTMW